MRVGVAGAGAVGQALGRRIREAGQNVSAIAGRDPARTAIAARFVGLNVSAVSYGELCCERVLIAVPDRAVVEVAERIPTPEIALHTCGAYGCELLEKLAARGASCGSLHPLQTFASPQGGYAATEGIAFAIDGDAPAERWATELVELLGGIALRIPSAQRPLYHAAAAMASNHLLALLHTATTLMERAGVAPTRAREALAPISRTALDNFHSQGEAALTGPVARGDVKTVRAHWVAIRNAVPQAADLYRDASLQALAIAQRRGLPADLALAVESVFGDA